MKTKRPASADTEYGSTHHKEMKMSNLIVIQTKQIGNEEVNAVDARELHGNLGVKKDFTGWIKYNISKLNLLENIDYLLTQKGEQLPSGTKYRSEYILTIDAAKHIAMMAGTSKAHEVRTYFIEFEKAHKNNPLARVSDPQTRALITLLAETDAIKQEQARHRAMIEDVTSKVDDIVPAHTAHTLNAIQGAISHAAKWYREINVRKNIPIKHTEAQVHITSMLLDREGVSDIGYIHNTTAALNYLRKLASHYKGEFDAFMEKHSLFARA